MVLYTHKVNKNVNKTSTKKEGKKAMEKIKKTFKELAISTMFIKLSHGNKKLKESARVGFLIWNIPAVVTCPFRTALCEKYCYARKAENIYPDALPSRQKNFDISRSADFVDRMIYTIDAELSRPKYRNKKVVFRIHESGDFYNKEYAEKWLSIARHYAGNDQIVFVAYTKSVTYFDGVQLPGNFFLLASVWSDTTPENMEIIRRNNFRIYTAYKDPELENAIKAGYSLCRCDDCAGCGKCWNNYINNIACEIH